MTTQQSTEPQRPTLAEILAGPVTHPEVDDEPPTPRRPLTRKDMRWGSTRHGWQRRPR